MKTKTPGKEGDRKSARHGTTDKQHQLATRSTEEPETTASKPGQPQPEGPFISLKEAFDPAAAPATCSGLSKELPQGDPCEFLEAMKFTFRLRPKADRAKLVPLILSIADPDARAKGIAISATGRNIIAHISGDQVKSLVDAALDLLENATMAPDLLKELSQAMDFFDGPMDIGQQKRLAILRNNRHDVGYFLRNRPRIPRST